MCVCHDYLEDSWDCIKDGQDLHILWWKITEHDYEYCDSLDYNAFLQKVCQYIDQDDVQNCYLLMDKIWKGLRYEANMLERHWIQIKERIKDAYLRRSMGSSD